MPRARSRSSVTAWWATVLGSLEQAGLCGRAVSDDRDVQAVLAQVQAELKPGGPRPDDADTLARRRSRGGAAGCGVRGALALLAGPERRAERARVGAVLFDPCHDPVGEPRAVEGVDLAYAGGTRHVDLGQVIADDVEPDEYESRLSEGGRETSADLPVARGDLVRDDRSAGGHVAPELAAAGHPAHYTDRLAVQDDDAPVSLAGLLDEPLDHHLIASPAGGGIDDRPEVRVAAAQQHDATACHAVGRLDDRGAPGVGNADDLGRARRDQGVRAEVGPAQGEQLLVRVPETAGAVEDESTAGVNQVEEIGAAQVGGIHRRIGAHEDGVGLLQHAPFTRTSGEPVRRRLPAAVPQGRGPDAYRRARGGGAAIPDLEFRFGRDARRCPTASRGS